MMLMHNDCKNITRKMIKDKAISIVVYFCFHKVVNEFIQSLKILNISEFHIPRIRNQPPLHV